MTNRCIKCNVKLRARWKGRWWQQSSPILLLLLSSSSLWIFLNSHSPHILASWCAIQRNSYRLSNIAAARDAQNRFYGHFVKCAFNIATAKRRHENELLHQEAIFTFSQVCLHCAPRESHWLKATQIYIENILEKNFSLLLRHLYGMPHCSDVIQL